MAGPGAMSQSLLATRRPRTIPRRSPATSSAEAHPVKELDGDQSRPKKAKPLKVVQVKDNLGN